MSKHEPTGRRPRKQTERTYEVKVGFLNPNADYTMHVAATSRWNAVWRASERLIGSGGSVTHVNGVDVLALR